MIPFLGWFPDKIPPKKNKNFFYLSFSVATLFRFVALRTLVGTGSRWTVFKGIFSGGFFEGGFYPDTVSITRCRRKVKVSVVRSPKGEGVSRAITGSLFFCDAIDFLSIMNLVTLWKLRLRIWRIWIKQFQ